jgi:hypothetical protein
MNTGTAVTNADAAIRPFHVEIADEAIADLRRRIAAWRPPEREPVDDQSQGVQLATVHALARYWAADYDWRRCEAKLNALPQFTTEIDGLDIHFIHVRSAQQMSGEASGPGAEAQRHGFARNVVEPEDLPPGYQLEGPAEPGEDADVPGVLGDPGIAITSEDEDEPDNRWSEHPR